MPARMRCDDDTVVTDMQQPISRFDRDRFTGEVTPDVITVLEDADASCPIDAPTNRLGPGRWCLFDRAVAVDDLERQWLGQLEAPDRRHVTQGLMLPVVVVVGHPHIQGRLHLVDRIEALVGEELLAHGLVQALDLAGGGWRIGCG